MKVLEYANAQDFLTKCQNLLEQQEVINSLLLGRAMDLVNNPESGQVSRFFSVNEQQDILFTCLQTSPHNFIFSPVMNQNGLDLLLDYLIKRKIFIPGLIGPRNLVLKAAELWTQKTGGQYKIEMRQLIYQLKTVTFGPKPKGQFRPAQIRDQGIIQKWMLAFSLEAMREASQLETVAKAAQQKIKDQHLFVWEDTQGRVLTMAGITRPTRNGICINYVYTPPAYRRQGLAAACVAALSQHLLDQGYQFCTLFTDEDFPTSNRIYQSLGYREVAAFASISLLK